MHTGMLWFDNDPQATLNFKIQKALDYYVKKYEKQPNLVLVHPSTMQDQELPENITVRPYRPVLPGHIWIGIEDESK